MFCAFVLYGQTRKSRECSENGMRVEGHFYSWMDSSLEGITESPVRWMQNLLLTDVVTGG